ncbi:MAG: hypothetical protein ACXVX9_13040, partial [Mycobacteriaceae bacterium]
MIAAGGARALRVSRRAWWRGRSGRDAVAEVHDTVAESAIVQQLEVGASVAGQRGLASAEEDRTDEQTALIDQPALESVRARCGPPTVRSLVAEAFMSSTEAGSKLRTPGRGRS